MNGNPDLSQVVSIPLGPAGVPSLPITPPLIDALRSATGAPPVRRTGWAYVPVKGNDVAFATVMPIISGGLLTEVFMYAWAGTAPASAGWGLRAGNSLPTTAAEWFNLPTVLPSHLGAGPLPGWMCYSYAAGVAIHLLPGLRVPTGYSLLIAGAVDETGIPAAFAIFCTIESPAP